MAYKIFAPVSLCLLLAGCGLFRKKPEGNEAPLIPRAVLFGNPEKGCVRISPDGLKLAYLAPCEGVLNIWVRTLGQQDDHPVTHDQKRGIREFVWAKNNTHLLFLQDTDGDENWHIYRADLKTLKIADLTPFPGVRARVLSVDKKFPDTVLVTLNKNNPTTLFDVYELDIPSGNLKLVAKNPGNIDVWLADSNLQVRAAVTVKPDGSTVLLVRDNPGSKWIQKQVWSLEDSLAGLYPPAGSRPISFSRDGKFLYLIDSAGANTQRLVKMGLETGAREVLAFDDQYDVHAVVCGQDTGEPELVSWERARTEWKVLRPELEQDLTRILAANTGDLISIDRSSDDTKWVLYFENDIAPGAYYLYDRKAREPVDATQDMLRLCKSTLRQAQGERLVGTALCKSTQAGVTTSTSLLPLILPVLRSNPSCEGGSETKSSRRTAGTAGRTGSCIDFLFYDRPELAKYQLAPTKPISFVARDGLIIHGYLTCPLGKEPQNLPLVLQVHGGPWSYRNIWGFSLPTNAEAQLFANRGYACLQVNFRGSPGYGKRFLSAGDREFAGKMHTDLIDAVAWAVKEGIADSHKIAMYGSSYGGYAALVGATFTPDVFCCAIDLWGMSNLLTLVPAIVSFSEMGRAKWYKRVGNPETEPEFLKSRSPLFKVDQITIPVFIAQGTNDPRVPQAESEQIVAALKAKGLAHEYMLFPGEGHGIMRPENRFKLAVAIEKFLAKCLGGRFEV